MRYIITGATSFIGIALSQYLLDHGQEVVAVCRPNSKGLHALPKGVSVVWASMDEYDQLPEHITQADVLINLAWGGTGHDGRDMVTIQQENIHHSIAALKAANKMGCTVFVEAGSQAEYGETTICQHEDMACAPFSEYGKAKLEFKNKAFELAEQLSIQYVHLRIFSLFGETDHPWTLVMSCVDKMRKNEPIALSPCTQNWNFLYINDAVDKIVALVEYTIAHPEQKHEVYNMVSRDTRVLREFVEQMRILIHSNSELQFGAVIPEHLVSLQPDRTKLEKAIGSRHETPFDEVIKKIIDNYD